MTNRGKIVLGIGIAVPLLLLIAAAVVAASAYLEHRALVAQEIEAYPAPGRLVPIGAEGDDGSGDRLHVYAEGEGDPTLVFLSGHGTAAPFFDFKPLFERLSEHHRIAVVERAGYGWSDVTDSPRDLDTVLRETRNALAWAGEAPPYVLFPHSLAGLEAIHWASTHPGEVTGIIGLDPLVPGYFERGGETATPSLLQTILARTGLMRQGGDVFDANFPAMLAGRLTEQEAKVAETVFLRRTHTPNMWAEARALADNAARLSDVAPPDVPLHLFVSDRMPDAWQDALAAYADAAGGGHDVLDAGHYVHLDEPDRIAATSRELIQEMAARLPPGR
jgi:pimeloyl-ACP methyl ester carboxylesterase